MATTTTFVRVVVGGVTYDCVVDPTKVREGSARPRNVTQVQWANVMNCKAALRRESERNINRSYTNRNGERLPTMTFAQKMSSLYGAIYSIPGVTVTYIIKDDEVSFSTTELGEFLSLQSFMGSLERAGVPMNKIHGGAMIGRGGTRYYKMSMPCPHDEKYLHNLKTCRGQKPSFYTGTTAPPVVKKESRQDAFATAMDELRSAKDELSQAVADFKKITRR